MRIVQELVPGRQITLLHIIANPDNVPVGTVITIPASEKYGIDANDTTAISVALEKAAIIKQRMKQ